MNTPLNILFVDDDPMIRAVYEGFGEALNIDLIIVDNGKDAIEIFKEKYNEIACVILDIIMPDMNGIEVLEEIKKIYPDANVILVSGYTEKYINKKLGYKNVVFLIKPILLVELKELLENINKTNPIEGINVQGVNRCPE